MSHELRDEKGTQDPELPQRPHDGKIITLASDLRWCSNASEIGCWNGEKAYAAFSMDHRDREAIAWDRRESRPRL